MDFELIVARVDALAKDWQALRERCLATDTTIGTILGDLIRADLRDPIRGIVITQRRQRKTAKIRIDPTSWAQFQTRHSGRTARRLGELTHTLVATPATTTESANATASPAGLDAALEGVLISLSEPATIIDLADAVGATEPIVELALNKLATDYSTTRRGMIVQERGGRWALCPNVDEPAVSRAVTNFHGRPRTPTKATLETLAIIAYRQPIARSEIAKIRGVTSVDAIMRQLEAGQYVVTTGERNPAREMLYRTTQKFLRELGLNSLDELPPLGTFMPAAGEAARIEASLNSRPTRHTNINT